MFIVSIQVSRERHSPASSPCQFLESLKVVSVVGKMSKGNVQYPEDRIT